MVDHVRSHLLLSHKLAKERFAGMQMARRIDAVDFSLRQEQQRTMQALQAVLSGGKIEAKVDNGSAATSGGTRASDA